MRELSYIIGLVAITLLSLCQSCGDSRRDEAAGGNDCGDVSAHVHTVVAQAGDLISEGQINGGFKLLTDAEGIIENLPDSGTRCVERGDMYRLYAYKAKIYTAYKDFRNAAKYYGRSIRFARNAMDSLQMTLDLSVIAGHGGDSATAIHAASRIPAFRVTDTLYRSYAYAVAEAYIEKFFGDAERSRDLFTRGLAISRSDGFNLHSRLTPISELYEYHNSKGNLDSSLVFLNEYKILADTFKTPDMMADVNKGFMRAYILKGDSDRALAAFNRYFTIVDSLYNPAGFSVLNSEYSDENLSRTTDKMMKLELEVSRFKMIIILIIVVLAVGGIVWFVCRTLIQSRKRIFFLNREIARTETPALESLPDHNVEKGTSRHAELMKAIDAVLADPEVYCNPEFSIAELARLVDSNTKYVSMAINESTGMNFRSYINSLRVKIARVRLTSSAEYSNRTIQAVSESVGFKSTSNFVIAFKKVMGVTPSAYQKLAYQNGSLD